MNITFLQKLRKDNFCEYLFKCWC